MTLLNEIGTVVSNEEVGPRLFVMTIRSPRLAQNILPGQFVHTRLPGMDDHILRRPFSVYTVDHDEQAISILYQVVGYGSQHMTKLEAGVQVENIGPLGQGWKIPEADQRVLIVGGGVGAAPVYLLCKEGIEKGACVDVILGARNKDAQVCRTEFEKLRLHSLTLATDDGSLGYAGFCTEPCAELLAENHYDFLAVCGPEPLMKAVAQQAQQVQVPCQVSLERRMACGVGACLSCVVETIYGKQRACVDGPVFWQEEVVWS